MGETGWEKGFPESCESGIAVDAGQGKLAELWPNRSVVWERI